MYVYIKINEEKLKKLLDQGFALVDNKSKYEKFRFKGETNLILYTSGKLVLNGKQNLMANTDKLLIKLNIIKKEQSNSGNQSIKTDIKSEFKINDNDIITGGDESLKGDTFGGIVIAVVKADKRQRQILNTLEIKDSKKISDLKIPKLAKMIKELCEYRILSIEPYEFNTMNINNNITQILNKSYTKLCKEFSNMNKIIIDKYPGASLSEKLNAETIFTEKGESKVVEIAAASILAREQALKQIDKLKKKSGLDIPKGSTHVAHTLKILISKKIKLDNYVKLSFNNVKCLIQKNN